MRSLPRLHFKADRAIKAQASIIAAINKAVGSLDAPAPADAPEPAQPDEENDRDADGPRNQSGESA